MKKKVVLMILDGWGHGKKDHTDGIYNAKTPFMDSLYGKWPFARLLTDGLNVGLPEGQMGNSEVGHLNIGAGRIVHQDLVKINNAAADGTLAQNEALLDALNTAKAPGKKLHFIGLVSDGGVHSSQEHLHALCSIAASHGLENVFVHAFSDGRDTDPKSGIDNIKRLVSHLSSTGGKLASVVGRYYAMDRDKRWERVKLAYDLLTKGIGEASTNAASTIQQRYDANETDEFLKPIVMQENGAPVATIDEGDVVICFNFRTDRCREITMALTQQDFPDHGMSTMDLHYTTMTRYDKTFRGVNVIFDKENLQMTLGETLETHQKSQLRIAETEKYPHVTFFFSGGREKPFDGESRIMIDSPKVATYDLQPEMSAPEVTDAICGELEKGELDFICLNFANPDMVGHTGVFEAVVKACETIDNCASRVVETGMANGYSFVIIADHGNADFLINADGSPHTAHTTNPVPVILIHEGNETMQDGILADVAPTILKMLGVPQPAEMTGKALY